MEDFFSKSIVKANATREGGTGQEGHTPPPSRSAPLLVCEGEAGCTCLLPFVWKQGCRAGGRGCVPLPASAPLPGRVSPACPPSWSVPGAQPQRRACVCLSCTTLPVARPLSSQLCAPLLVACPSSWSCAALLVATPPPPPSWSCALPLSCVPPCPRGSSFARRGLALSDSPAAVGLLPLHSIRV